MERDNLSLETFLTMEEALEILSRSSKAVKDRSPLQTEGRIFDLGFITTRLEERFKKPFGQIPQPIVLPLQDWIDYRIEAIIARVHILREKSTP